MAGRKGLLHAGSGYKGINYYLWRADLGGMVWNNREKTRKYDEAVKVNHLINRWGEELARCEKLRSDAGILYFLHGAAYCEAMPGGETDNRRYRQMYARYNELKDQGVTADFIQAEDLERNPLGIRLLFVPCLEALDEQEKAWVSAFARKHPVILQDNRLHPDCGEEMSGLFLISDWCHHPNTARYAPQEMRSAFRLPEILDFAGIHPLVRAHARRNALACQALMEQGASHPLPALSLLNISTNGGPLENGCVEIDAAAFPDLARCVYADRHIETELPIRKEGGVYRISVPMAGDIAAAPMFVYPQK